MNTLKNVVSFVVTADEHVEQDFISVTFSATETGSDANAVQTVLALRLKDALDIARIKEVKGQVEVRSGSFQIIPTYDKDNNVNGYHGQANMIVSGIDTSTIVALTGDITSMNVFDIQQSVSANRRKEVEQELSIRAIRFWKERSKLYADNFVSTSFRLISADISFNTRYPVYAKIESVSSGIPVSTEPGKETITATISGSIQLL